MKSQKLSILMIARGELEYPNTGTEVFVSDLIRQMQKDGCKIDVICSGKSRAISLNNKVKYHKITTSNKQYLSSLSFILEARKYFQNNLKNNKYDFLITFGVGAITTIIFTSRTRINKRVYYAIDTMVDEYNSKSNLLGAAQRINYQLKIVFDYLACKMADIVFCSSQKTLLTVSHIYKINKNKLKLQYFGIKDSVFSRKAVKNDIKPFDILLIATEHKRKGSMFFLKTLLRLKKKHQLEPKSIIVGNQDSELSHYISNNKIDVKIVDRMSNKELYNYYSSCKFLVVPSTSEGFCLPVIEAAVLEKPAIVSNVGSLPEIVCDGKTGLVSSLEIGKFSSKIAHMLNMSLCKKLGKYAKKNSQKYRISNTSKEVIIYLLSKQ